MPHIANWYFSKVQFVIIVLVRPNCRWDPFAFLFVQGVVNNGPVVKGSLAGIFIGVYHGVFAPVLIHGQCLLSFNWFWVVIFIHTVLVVLPGISKYSSKIVQMVEILIVSYLECAPRDSLRASAETMVCWALIMQFCNSRVSTRSEFQTMLLSETLRSSIWFQIPFIFSTPFFKTCRKEEFNFKFCYISKLFSVVNLRFQFWRQQRVAAWFSA